MRQVRVVDQRNRRLHDLTQVVRRDVGRHPDRDARRTVDEQVRNPRGKHCRLQFTAVEIRPVRDGLLVDVGQELHRQRGQARLGVPIRGGGVAIDGTEIPLAIDERIAQGEILHHSHHRVVDGRVPVGVILTQDVADHRRALLVRAARAQPGLAHREEDAAVNGLEAIPHVGKRALNDDAHRIVDERFAHFVLEQPRQNLLAALAPSSYELKLVTHASVLPRLQSAN